MSTESPGSKVQTYNRGNAHDAFNTYDVRKLLHIVTWIKKLVIGTPLHRLLNPMDYIGNDSKRN